MCYLRDRWGQDPTLRIPLPPKVITWSTSYDNPAGTPYIIMEYAPGVPLALRFYSVDIDEAKACLKSLAHLEYALLRDVFSEYGSLYFREDLAVDCQCSFQYLVDRLPLLLEVLPCICSQSFWWHSRSREPPFLFLPQEKFSILLSHAHCAVDIPKFCATEAV